jgi:hypothetical protein
LQVAVDGVAKRIGLGAVERERESEPRGGGDVSTSAVTMTTPIPELAEEDPDPVLVQLRGPGTDGGASVH